MVYEHVLGGRTFLEVAGDLTIEHRFHIQSLIEEAGMGLLNIEEGEDAIAFVRRILAALVRNRSVLQLIGCVLVPEDAVPRAIRDRPEEAWTPELAEDTARFIGSLRSEGDAAKVNSLVLSFLEHFFRNGIASARTTPTSWAGAIPTTIPTTADGTGPGPA